MRLSLEIEISGESATVEERRGRELTIGRDPDCDFALPDIQAAGIASAFHAAFSVSEGTLQVSDLGSSNGTFCSGQRIRETQSIAVGESVELGRGGPVVRVREFSANETSGSSSGGAASSPVPTGTRTFVVAVAGIVLLAGGVWGGSLLNGEPQPAGHETGALSTVSAVEPSSSGTVELPSETAENVGKPVSGEAAVETTAPAQMASLDAVQQSVGCLGFRFDGELHGSETAWLVAPDRVVTSARVAGTLQRLRDFDAEQRIELVVIQLAEQPVAVREIRLHPQYDFDNPGTTDSLLHDVAVLTLEVPVSNVPACRLASPQAVAGISAGTTLRLIGFENPTVQTDLFDPLRILRQERPLTITGSELPSGGMTPVLKSSFSVTKGLAGAPVFDAQGQVTGLLTQRKSAGFVVPVSVILEMVKR